MTFQQYLYFTVSVDGGQTFLPPVKISQKPSCPLDGKNGWAGIRWKPGGDYQGLATTANGNFLTLWSDSRSGVFQLYQAEIKVSASNVYYRIAFAWSQRDDNIFGTGDGGRLLIH